MVLTAYRVWNLKKTQILWYFNRFIYKYPIALLLAYTAHEYEQPTVTEWQKWQTNVIAVNLMETDRWRRQCVRRYFSRIRHQRDRDQSAVHTRTAISRPDVRSWRHCSLSARTTTTEARKNERSTQFHKTSARHGREATHDGTRLRQIQSHTWHVG